MFQMDSQEHNNLENELAHRNGVSVVIESLMVSINIFTALGGNLLVCWTIFKNSRLRSTSNILIACLAAVFRFPFTLAVVLKGRWPFNKVACDFQGFSFTVFGTFSILTITLTAIARYFKVCRSTVNRKVFSKRNICVFVAAAFSMSTIFPIASLVNDAFAFHPGKFICIYDCNKLNVSVCLSMGAFLTIVCYGPIVLCYICIFQAVQQHNTQLANSTKDRVNQNKIQVDEMRVTKLLLAIVTAFTCCWSPLIIIDGIGLFTGEYWMPREVYMTYTYLAGYSSSINPIIYGIFNQQLRQELCKILVCNGRRRTRVHPQISAN